MRHLSLSAMTAMLLALNLAGCGTIPYFDDDQSQQGALILTEDKFQKIDLAMLLVSNIKTVHSEIQTVCPKASSTKLFQKENENQYNYQERLQCAFNQFYLDKNEQALRRNRVQDRIIAASNQRCANYKKHVRRTYTTNNAILGGFTTLAAGLGSIFTSESVVRSLAGTAGILSGVRAEINEVYFQQNTIQLLAQGFEDRRKEILEEILNRRSSAGIEDYNVELAVADAILYHDACSMLTGLQRLALNQKRAEEPGFKQLNKMFKSLGMKSLNMEGTTSTFSITGGVMPVDGMVLNTALLQQILIVFFKAQQVKTQIESYQKNPELAMPIAEARS